MARRAIPRSCSAFSNQACSGGRPLIQDFLGFESRVDKGVGIVALLCKAVLRRDEDVDGQDELLAYRPADGVAPFEPVVEGVEDDEEIDVAVGADVAAGVAAEEDDLLRVGPFGDQPGDDLNCRPVDICVPIPSLCPYRRKAVFLWPEAKKFTANVVMPRNRMNRAPTWPGSATL